MAVNINADTVVGGAVVTADASGQLALQGAGVTQLTVTNTGVTLVNPLPVASGGTGVTTSTGSGANVLGTNPSITNPTLNLSGVAGANNSVLEIIQASSLYF